MREKHQQIFEQIKKAERILLTIPTLWNGDAIASALAFRLLLKKMNKQVEIISAKDELTDYLSTSSFIFSFLPGFNDIKTDIDDLDKFVITLNTSQAKVQKIKYKAGEKTLKFFITPLNGKFSSTDVRSESGLGEYDLIITLDTLDLESLGTVFQKNTQFFYKTPIINIDHHGENEEYGQINLVDLNAVSTSEILFSLINSENENLIDNDIATCLLTGMIIKTKNFKTANITPETLLGASKLVSKEARRDEIVTHLFRSRNIRVLKLWGRILANLSGLKNNRLIWSSINETDFIGTGTSSTDLSDIIDELIINIPEAEVIIIFYENSNKKDEFGRPKTDLLIHTPKNLKINDLMREYNPRGTDKFMRIETQKALKEVKNDIITLLDKKIGQYNF